MIKKSILSTYDANPVQILSACAKGMLRKPATFEILVKCV
jgi:hypothetical protein